MKKKVPAAKKATNLKELMKQAPKSGKKPPSPNKKKC